jgi:hypothetical protein
MAKPVFQEAELQRHWKFIQKDRDGARALKALRGAGFDATAGRWPYTIAAIPSLPSGRAGSSALPPPTRAARQVVSWLRQAARAAENGSQIEARDPRQRVIYMNGAEEIAPPRLLKVATELEELTHMRWVVIRHNTRQNVIATLRWEIRWRLRMNMDNELLDLLDAAYRAAGQEGVPLNLAALEKVEMTERNTRVGGRRKLLGKEFPLKS